MWLNILIPYEIITQDTKSNFVISKVFNQGSTDLGVHVITAGKIYLKMKALHILFGQDHIDSLPKQQVGCTLFMQLIHETNL